MKRVIALVLFFFGYQLLFQTLGMLAALIVEMMQTGSWGEWSMDRPASIAGLLGGQILATLAIGLHVLWAKDIEFDQRTLAVGPFRQLVLAVLLMVSMGVWTNYLTECLDLPDYNAQLVRQMMDQPWGILCIALLAPVAEELLFRGAIQQRLFRLWQRPSWAIAGSALIFGLAHLNPMQIPFAILMGLALGTVYQQTGSLLFCIVMHIVNNGGAVLLYYLSRDTAESTMADALGETGALVLAVAGVLVSIGCLRLLKNCR